MKLVKTCSKCNIERPITEFNKHTCASDGLQSYCRACGKAASIAWYSKNKERHNARQALWVSANSERKKASMAAWQASNQDKRRVHGQNRRARKRNSGEGLSPLLSEKLFKLHRGKCACCGHPLGSDYHLDHIMPLALGGTNTDDNIQLLRSECNLQKHAKHPVDFMQQRGWLL